MLSTIHSTPTLSLSFATLFAHTSKSNPMKESGNLFFHKNSNNKKNIAPKASFVSAGGGRYPSQPPTGTSCTCARSRSAGSCFMVGSYFPARPSLTCSAEAASLLSLPAIAVYRFGFVRRWEHQIVSGLCLTHFRLTISCWLPIIKLVHLCRTSWWLLIRTHLHGMRHIPVLSRLVGGKLFAENPVIRLKCCECMLCFQGKFLSQSNYAGNSH